MNNMASTRMLLSIAALAALAALFGGGANAKGLDEEVLPVGRRRSRQ